MILIGGQFYQRTLFSIAEGVRLQDSWLYTLPERKGKKKNLKTLVKDKTKHFQELNLAAPNRLNESLFGGTHIQKKSIAAQFAFPQFLLPRNLFIQLM